ncbi:hypothetical protein D3C76_1870750 [compost metagenome]
MQADAHHLRQVRAFLPEQVEAILEQLEEVSATGEAVRQQVASIVVDQGVRDYQMRG